MFSLQQQSRPFVAVNCGGVAPNLVESEMFGHAKGAFTGAISAKTGFLAQSSGGDLLLDELQNARSKGKLMPDFVARLRQDMLELPPLRERRDDIPLLIEIAKRRLGKSDKEFSEDALTFLQSLN